MKLITTIIQSWCDYPDCAKLAEMDGKTDQETFAIDFWVNIVGRGRRTAPVSVEVCAQHRDALREVFRYMKQFDTKIAEQ